MAKKELRPVQASNHLAFNWLAFISSWTKSKAELLFDLLRKPKLLSAGGDCSFGLWTGLAFPPSMPAIAGVGCVCVWEREGGVHVRVCACACVHACVCVRVMCVCVCVHGVCICVGINEMKYGNKHRQCFNISLGRTCT